jgi:oligoribonuclease
MDSWCKNHHTKNGLIKDVLLSTTTREEAETQTLDFIKKYCPPKTGILSGNTIWQDRLFLQKYMPSIVNYLHYRVLDVTSIKIVAKRWYPQSPFNEYKKNDAHRARSDIYESIAELKNYRTHFFVQ